MEKAVVITGAKNSYDGIAAEYSYVESKYGVRNRDWTLVSQQLTHNDGKDYDLLNIKLSDDTQLTVYFDITKFYGKF